MNATDTAKYLFATEEEMSEAKLSAAARERLMRLRSGYTFWTSRPTLFPRAVISFLEKEFKIPYRTAWADVHDIKMLLGNMQDEARQYREWQFYQRFEEAWQAARESKSPASEMGKLLAVYVKAAHLDRDEPQRADYAAIQPQQFVITADPADAGFKRIPNIEEKARRLLARYTQDVEEYTELSADNSEY